MKKADSEFTPEETAKRAEEAIRRSFAKPHTPHKSLIGTTPRAKAMARRKAKDPKSK